MRVGQDSQVSYLLPLWTYPISFSLTLCTGVLLFWQYFATKGTAGHVMRWAAALFLSVFVVYMNTVTVLNQPRTPITNPWHLRFMEFHQNVGLTYFGLMAAMPFLGGSLMVAIRCGWSYSTTLRVAHKWASYAAGACWLVSNIASEIGTRIPRI
jgi:hypothetical protein